MADLPEKMTINGFAINTEFSGNGLFFRHDEMADVAGQKAHFVANHDRDIRSIAGSTEFLEAKRKEFSVSKLVEPGGEGKEPVYEEVQESATVLPFKAELSAMFNGYEPVARNIIALKDSGLVPNVSVYVYGTRLSYEEDTDRFFMEGPYEMAHLGQVDKGAFGDDVGVGVFDVQMSVMNDIPLKELGKLNADGDESPIGVSICLANQDKLVTDFVEANLGEHPDWVEKLGKALGKDSEHEEEAPETKAALTSAERPNKNLHTSEVEDTSERETPQVDTMTETETPETPVAQVEEGHEETPLKEDPAPTGANLSEDTLRKIVESAVKPLQDEVAQLKADKKDADDRALNHKRKSIADKLGLDDDESKTLDGMSEEQLALIGERFDIAGKVPNTLGRGSGFDDGDFGPAEQLKKKMADAKAWHARRYLHKESE